MVRTWEARRALRLWLSPMQTATQIRIFLTSYIDQRGRGGALGGYAPVPLLLPAQLSLDWRNFADSAVESQEATGEANGFGCCPPGGGRVELRDDASGASSQ